MLCSLVEFQLDEAVIWHQIVTGANLISLYFFLPSFRDAFSLDLVLFLCNM